MAAPGANLSFKGTSRLWARAFKLMGFRTVGWSRARNSMQKRLSVADDGTSALRLATICSKSSDTAPANNTAADAPTGKHDWCVHYTADNTLTAVYICTVYTDVNTFTWTKVSAN